MPLHLRSFSTPGALLEVARPFLEAHEDENGLPLGLLTGVGGEATVLVVAFDADVPVLVAIQRGLHLVLTRGPVEAMDPMAEHLLEQGAQLPGVVGPPALVDRFSQRWEELGQGRRKLAMEQKIWRLDTLIPPPPTPGRARPMEPQDVDTVTDWLRGFHEEAVPDDLRDNAWLRRNAEARVGTNDTFLWVVDGASVSMAALSRPSPNGINVNAVYTPPEHRRRGYAAAITAAVSTEGLRRKRFCVLYTDLANPTSNGIYARLGYRPIAESRLWVFQPHKSSGS